MGKTGTAQKYENGKIATGKYVSSFFGTYPATNPQYAVLLCVNEPSQGAYYGSVVASPYAKTLFKQIFDYKNIPPDNANVTVQQVTIPNFVAKPLSWCITELDKLGLYYEIDGEGGVVTSQIPAPNTTVYKNSTIVLST